MVTVKPDLLWNSVFWRQRGARKLSGSKPCGWRHLDGRTESEKQECSPSCLPGRPMWERDARHQSGIRWISTQRVQSRFFIPDTGKPQVLLSPAGPSSWLSSCSYLHSLFTSLPLHKKQGISLSSTSQHFRANMSSSIKVPWTNN